MKNKKLWISVAVFLLLAVIFAFTDWQISQALYNPESGWAHFLEGYGQIPGSLLGDIRNMIEETRSVLLQRAPLYQSVADYTVDTRNKNAEQAAEEIYRQLLEAGIMSKMQTLKQKTIE